ncbi:MAG: hypothetical protein AAFR61_00310 [Bacteroidota bacterium]
MGKLIRISILFLLLHMIQSAAMKAGSTKPPAEPISISSLIELDAEDLLILSVPQLQSLLGRNIKAKEKRMLQRIKKKLRRHPEMTPKQAWLATQADTYALLSLIMGALGLAAFYSGLLLGGLAIIFGIQALRKRAEAKNPKRTKKRATWGLIFGGLAFGLGAVYVVRLFTL